MKTKLQLVLGLTVIALAAMWLASCDHYVCSSGATFGNSSCTPSGSGLGTGTGGGPTISAGNATVLTFFLNGTSVDGAGFGGSTFANLAGFTPPTIPSGSADNMTIVNKQFVYVPNGIDTTIQAFSINRSSGALTQVPNSPFSVITGTADGAWSDPQGRFLFVGSEGAGEIWAFTIDQTTGALTEVTGSPFTTGLSFADIIAVDASGKFLYVGQGNFTASVTGEVVGFAIAQPGSTNPGSLTPLNGGNNVFNLGIAQIRTSPTAELLLGVQEIQDAGAFGTGSGTQQVFVYSIDPNSGIPTAVTGSPFTTAGVPFDLTISPNGQYVYLPEAQTTGAITSMEGFKINSNGSLTSLGAPFSSLPDVTQCLFDQKGQVMICTTSSGTTAGMTALTASPTTGALTHVADFNGVPFAFAVTD